MSPSGFNGFAAAEALPEFKRVAQEHEFYEALVQANQRHKLVARRQKQQAEDEVKDEIMMFQFRLTHRESGKFFNSFTFLNVPLSRATDPNLQVL